VATGRKVRGARTATSDGSGARAAPKRRVCVFLLPGFGVGAGYIFNRSFLSVVPFVGRRASRTSARLLMLLLRSWLTLSSMGKYFTVTF